MRIEGGCTYVPVRSDDIGSPGKKRMRTVRCCVSRFFATSNRSHSSFPALTPASSPGSGSGSCSPEVRPELQARLDVVCVLVQCSDVV